ncbi:NAD(P)-dependent oxidoreductase [Agarivorans sp. QJM3NY_25]|uniref:NAD(P)-dependent oxidoreductase n=1 Tax=Agarivorans sp. QJM3NY_25 TaxID=3421430 RepID=UPI003D7E956C
MKVAVLGASGWIGSHIAAEAKQRGHQVLALVREPGKITDPAYEVRQFDIQQSADQLSEQLEGVDVLLASISGRAAGNHEIVAATAEQLLAQLPNSSVERLLWVGGAGSLEVAPGVTLASVPEFPAEYKAESTAQAEALQVFKQTTSSVNWTYISPAAEIFPGDKQADYRIGGEQLLSDEQGNSRISVSDYAVAVIDELESGRHPKQRIGVAY